MNESISPQTWKMHLGQIITETSILCALYLMRYGYEINDTVFYSPQEYHQKVKLSKGTGIHALWRNMNKKTPGILVIITLTLVIPSMIAGATPTITIDPINIHQSGEIFEITGTTTDPSCKRIGMEIFPTPYWDNACRIADMAHAQRIRFMVQHATESIKTVEQVKLIRYNPDRTESYIFYPPCPDYFRTSALVRSIHGKKAWVVTVGGNEGQIMTPGEYLVFVWDATDQWLYTDTYQPNGWDISGDLVYPATFRANVWDDENRQNCTKATINIVKSPSVPVYTDYSRLNEYVNLILFSA